MKRILRVAVSAALLFCILPVPSLAADFLIPVGEIIGLQLSDDTVTIAAYDDACGSVAKDAGLRIGDVITAVDGMPVTCAEDLRNAMQNHTGQITLSIRRGGKVLQVPISPKETAQGPRLGVYLKQGIAGIGTVTWYDPESSYFGALGHGVNDASGVLLNMTKGSAFETEIMAVKQGKCGDPGQLKGGADTLSLCGTLLRNTAQGVFGIHKGGWKGQPIPVADYEDIQIGPAKIRSTVSNAGPQEYSVEILKIYPEDRSDYRNFLIRVTDPELLNCTGGIVQGMSGSPIIQDGKLVGAVTHVLVNDPTRGYGIFIENMLDAAE